MRRILVVDDDPLSLTTLTMILEEAGYTVQTACDGTEALDTIGSAVPDMVICDIRLPYLNGVQLLDQLRAMATTAALPVLLMSASVRPRLDNHRHSAFLEKPIGIDILLHTVEQMLAVDKV